MTRTVMSDGRILCIAGEHEDSYDPDFCIYNDVVVLRPTMAAQDVTLTSGEVEIYGYPAELFPPTDFHSATPVHGTIYLVGRLGYQGTRMPGQTPVFALDVGTYEIRSVQTTGSAPGWIYKHHSSYDSSRHAITARGGHICLSDNNVVPLHFAAHRLHLADMRWELIAAHEPRRYFLLESQGPLGDSGAEPSVETFRPRTVAHEVLLPEDRGVSWYGISVDGARISFLAFYTQVQTEVEGSLPTDKLETLLAEIADNLCQATGAPWAVREVDRFDSASS
jgi:hypothetical protein